MHQETVRVIKPGGTLAVMEFKKIDGPPKVIRMSPREVEDFLATYGYKNEQITDVGPYNY